MSAAELLQQTRWSIFCREFLRRRRGFVYAIAHVRGGGDLGANWHADGMLMNKRNTFTDFITCAEHLIQARVLRAASPCHSMLLSRLCAVPSFAHGCELRCLCV